MLTQERLRDVLRYDPETGIFSRIKGKRKGEVVGSAHDARGILKVSIGNERHFLHRLGWLCMTGCMPRSNIEHINGDRSDNRWINLREGVRLQRASDLAPWRGRTRFDGVWKVGDGFEAMLQTSTVALNLGTFPTAEEALNVIREEIRKARARQAQTQWRSA